MLAFALIAAADAQPAPWPTASPTTSPTASPTTIQMPRATIEWHIKNPLANQSVHPAMSPPAIILLAIVMTVCVFYVMSLIAQVQPPNEDDPQAHNPR
jgi:hypothetical protein